MTDIELVARLHKGRSSSEATMMMKALSEMDISYKVLGAVTLDYVSVFRRGMPTRTTKTSQTYEKCRLLFRMLCLASSSHYSSVW